MEQRLYAGARAPEAVRVRVCRGDSLVDMRTATAATLLVRTPGGFEQQWSAYIAPGPLPAPPSLTELTVVHTFGAGEVDQPGRYVLVAMLTVPGGVVRADPVALEVVPQFGGQYPVAANMRS